MPRGLQERMANRNTGIHNWVQFTTIFKEKKYIYTRENTIMGNTYQPATVKTLIFIEQNMFITFDKDLVLMLRTFESMDSQSVGPITLKLFCCSTMYLTSIC